MMIFSKACKEVLESVVLFVAQQLQQHAVSSAQIQPSVSLNISAEESTDPAPWSVRVDASDLGVYYLDEKVFIDKLYTSCGALRSELDANAERGRERRELSVFSRRIGEYSTVKRHTAVVSTGTTGTSSPVAIEESTLPRPPDFPPYGLRMCFQLGRCSVEDMKREAHNVSSHMQLLHLTNPHVEMELAVKAGSEVLVTQQFSREPGWQPLTSSHFKLALSIQHFTSAATRQTKLRVTRGASYSLTEISMRNGSQLSLRLYCSAAVAPHISLPRGRKIPANRVCQQLRVYVFGPGGLPVSGPDSLTSLSLSSLADWETYGLSLSSPQLLQPSPEGLNGVVSCGHCQLSNSQRSPDSAGVVGSSGVRRDLTLLLFVFLEETGAAVAVGGGSSTTSYWSQRMDRVCELKETMEQLLQSQQKKFRQATHSVFNKLLCNYGTHFKTASIMRTALPLLADAVASIIRQSSNPQFQQRCQEILQTENRQKSEKECIADRLWEMAEKKLHVSKTHTNPPQEPPSPELEQALEDRVSSTGGDPTTTASHTTPLEPRRVSSERFPNAPLAEPSTSSAPQASKSPKTTSSSGPRKFSLFASTVASRRTKRDTAAQPIALPTNKPASETEVTGEGGSLEMNCFEALAGVEESSELPPDENFSPLPHSNGESTAAIVPSVNPVDNLPPEGEDLFFEQLATAEMEDYTIVEAQGPLHRTAESTTPTVIDSTETMDWMDWGEESEDGEFLEDIENGFSDLPSSESCENFGEEITKEGERNKSSLTEEPGIPLVETNATSKSCPILQISSDSDWEMLGVMAHDAETSADPPSHWLTVTGQSVKPPADQETPAGPHTGPAPTVPDITQADVSFTADIDEDDFHWY